MQDAIKCPICGTIYNPVYLDQVLEHMHAGMELKQTIKGEKVMETLVSQQITKEEILKQLSGQHEFFTEFENVTMWIQKRPPYCDRGAYMWSAESTSHKITIDHADMFPRYYFLIDSLVNEINAWIDKRKSQVGKRLSTSTH